MLSFGQKFCFGLKLRELVCLWIVKQIHYPFYYICLEIAFSTSAVLENCKRTHLIINLWKVMLFFLSLLIKDISTDKCCYLTLFHTKITDTLPSFYLLLSNMIDLLEKYLCLIIYYTYDFEKISKPSMNFSQQSLESL
jgi:hypothetical protein